MLPAAGGHQFGIEFALFQQIFFLAQYRHQDMGAVLLGNLDRIFPHIVVFRVGFGLAARDGVGGQADGGEHVAHLEHQGVVALVLARVVFLHNDVPFFFHVPDELLFVPFSLGQEDKARKNARVVCLIFVLIRRPGALDNLFLALPDHSLGIFILRVQFRPPLGIGDGFLLLFIEILIGIRHPHIPLRLVLALLPDGLQHLDGTPQGLFSFVIGGPLLMVAQDGVVLQCPSQGVGGAVVSPVLRDGVQCLNAAGVLVLVVPLLQLLEEFFLVLRGVGDVIHTRLRLLQLVGLLLVVRLLLGQIFQSHCARLPAEGVEVGPGDAAVLEELLGNSERRPDVPGDEVHIAIEEAGGPAGEGEHLRAVPGGEGLLQLVPKVENLRPPATRP